MASKNSVDKIIEQIKLDRGNRNRSPKNKDVIFYAMQLRELEINANVVRRIYACDDLGCKKVAAQLISTAGDQLFGELVDVCEALIRDSNWELREYGPFALIGCLGADGALEWSGSHLKSKDPRDRRGAAIVLRELLKSDKLRNAAIGMLDALASDTDKYVTDAVSPFAIGDQLFRVDRTSASLLVKKMSRSGNDRKRRNAALALSAASARPLDDSEIAILTELTLDAKPQVARAAEKSLKLAQLSPTKQN